MAIVSMLMQVIAMLQLLLIGTPELAGKRPSATAAVSDQDRAARRVAEARAARHSFTFARAETVGLLVQSATDQNRLIAAFVFNPTGVSAWSNLQGWDKHHRPLRPGALVGRCNMYGCACCRGAVGTGALQG